MSGWVSVEAGVSMGFSAGGMAGVLTNGGKSALGAYNEPQLRR